MFGNPETTTGGRALKFYSSVRVEVRRGATIKDGDKPVGSRTKVKIVKNKVAAPFKDVEIDLIHGEGFSREGDLIDLGVTHGVVDKSGSWLSFSGERIGQGRENAKQFLRDNAAVAERLEISLRRALGFDGTSSNADMPAMPVIANGKSAGNGRSTSVS
jgi:recombination protein RecA